MSTLSRLLRSLVGVPIILSNPGVATGVGLVMLERGAGTAEEEDPEPVRILKNRFRSTGPDLKAELHDIVKENPDAAATILRSWIGEAA